MTVSNVAGGSAQGLGFLTKVAVLLSAIMFLMAAAGTLNVAQAESLKNSEFLKFSEGQRHWWYLGTFTAFGHAVLLEDQEKGRCVLNWMYTEKDHDKKKAYLEDIFAKYPDNSPTSIIIAVLRRDCGVFPKN